MKKKIVFKEGTFEDFKGNIREYTICAISDGIAENDDLASDSQVKQLRLGISVRREGDEYDRGIGFTEAQRKATNQPFTILHADTAGVINSTVVSAILEQEGKYFENNPGKYITSYNKDRDIFEYELYLDELREQLSPKAKEVHDFIIAQATDEDLVILAECLMYDMEKVSKGQL